MGKRLVICVFLKDRFDFVVGDEFVGVRKIDGFSKKLVTQVSTKRSIEVK